MLTGHFLEYPARRFPDRLAVIGNDRRMTFAEANAEANQFANALCAAGYGKGANIAVMLPNIADYAVVNFGAARSGAVLAHLSYRYAAKDQIYALNKIGAELLVHHADYSGLVDAILPDLPRLRQRIVVGGSPDLGVSLADFISGQPVTPPTVEMTETDPYAITFTGGTTGLPKAVVVSHKSRTATAHAIVAQHGLSETDRAAIVTPLFHTAGLFVWFHSVIWLGCTCSLLPTWDPEAFLDLAERDRITAVFMVPTQLNGLIRHPNFDPARLATLRNVGFGGAPMPRALMSELRALLPKVRFTENYGQSEICPMTLKTHEEFTDHPDSIGRAAFNIEVDVFGPDGRPLPPGEVGEIVTRGDQLLVEYFDDPEQTRALFRGGDRWLWTGDLGFRDEAGYFTLVDRSKDMIISGGENIYPKEIEDVLFSHQAVSECAVFGIPDDHWGEVAAAHIVLKPGAAVTVDELIAFSVEQLARYKRPRLIEFVDEIAKTPVGKVQKHLMRAPYWKDHDKKI
jgi:acyl-CoA synthetase (AMP-forming)/AMP-acid ligase II